MDRFRLRDDVHRAAHPVGQLIHAFQHVNGDSGNLGACATPLLPSLVTLAVSSKLYRAGRYWALTVGAFFSAATH